MDLALDNKQRLIYHKSQPRNQSMGQIELLNIDSVQTNNLR